MDTHHILFEIFEKRLFSTFVEGENNHQFVQGVVEEYFETILKTTFIPATFAQDVVEETLSLVEEMLQKKIYGHFDVDEFRKANAKDC